MPSAISFTLNLIDRMSGPAKAATSALVQLQDQLKGIRDALKDMPKLSLKVPKLTDGALKQSKESIGPMFGPGRREALAAAKYQQSLDRDSTRAAEQLDKQRQRALYAEYQKQERQKATHHAVDAIQAHIAPIAGADHAAALAGTLKEVAELAGGHGLLNLASTLGAPLRGVYGLKRAIFELGEGFEHLTGISPTVAAGIAGVAAAAVVAAAVFVKFAEAASEWVFEGAKMAVEASEIKQDTLDMLDAMLGSAEAAERTLEAIRGVTKSTSVSQEAVQSSVQNLAAAGITNEKLLDGAVLAVAQVDSVLKGRGEKIEAVFSRAAQTGQFEINAKRLAGTGVQIQGLYEEIAKRTGKGVKQVEALMKSGKIKAETGIAALTSVINKKFGAVAAKQALDLGPQLQRLHSNISNLFEDVKTGPFLEGLDRMVSLFDKSTVAGGALHDVITDAFGAIFRVVEKVQPYVEVFFLGIELAALKVANAVRNVAYAWGISFGGENQDAIEAFEQSMLDFADAIGRVSHGFEVLAGYQFVWESLSTSIGLLASFTWLLIKPFVLAAGLLFELAAAALMAIDYFDRFGPEMAAAGSALVTGLVSGIKNAAQQLYDAVTELAKKALQTFRDIFKIHSPSRVMAGMGINISAGLARGISAGAGSSSSAMVGAGVRLSNGAAIGAQLGLLNRIPRSLAMNDNALADRSVPVRTADQSRGSTGGAVIHFHAEAGSFPITGVANAQELKSEMESVLANAFEQAALMNGTSSG